VPNQFPFWVESDSGPLTWPPGLESAPARLLGSRLAGEEGEGKEKRILSPHSIVQKDNPFSSFSAGQILDGDRRGGGEKTKIFSSKNKERGKEGKMERGKNGKGVKKSAGKNLRVEKS